MMNKYAIIIPTFENNIGYKLAGINTFLKHVPDNVDIFYVYGGNRNFLIQNPGNGKPQWFDVYIDIPDRISTVHKKLYKFFSKYKKVLSEYSHIIKIDDDTFINNIDEIDFDKLKGDYVGKKVDINDENQEQIRTKFHHLKNYKVREVYKGELPEQFCSGECVIFSYEAIKELISYQGYFKRTNFGLEDVFTGNILTNKQFKITNNKLISYEHPVKESDFHKLYITHYK